MTVEEETGHKTDGEESQHEFLRRLMKESLNEPPMDPKYDFVRQTRGTRSDEWFRWRKYRDPSHPDHE